MPSASGFPLLFGHFVGTARPSDFPSTCMLDFWITSFSNRPVHNCVSGVDGTSPFSRVKFPFLPGSPTAHSPKDTRISHSPMLIFRTLEQRRHSDFRPLFTAPYPACMFPCQRFTCSLATAAHDSGPGWLATPYLYD